MPTVEYDDAPGWPAQPTRVIATPGDKDRDHELFPARYGSPDEVWLRERAVEKAHEAAKKD